MFKHNIDPRKVINHYTLSQTTLASDLDKAEFSYW